MSETRLKQLRTAAVEQLTQIYDLGEEPEDDDVVVMGPKFNYVEYYSNFLPSGAPDSYGVTGTTDATQYFRDLWSEGGLLSGFVRFASTALEGLFASASNPFAHSDLTHSDVRRLVDAIAARHLPGAIAEVHAGERFPGRVLPQQDDDERAGIDLRIVAGGEELTFQVKSSWESFPSPSPSAARDADVLVAVRVSDDLTCELQVVWSA
jgi:hypothetical protein